MRSKQQFITGVLSMNLQAWEALKPEQQQVVQASAIAIMKDQFAKAQETDAAVVEKWKALGKHYIELDKDQLAALGEHVRAQVWPSMKSQVGDSIMAHIEKNASALK